MQLIDTGFDGLYILQMPHFTDNRGCFQKLFSKEIFIENNLDCDFKEIYYSVNNKNVIRGMHFQAPPSDHTKLVYVSRGRIRDVVVDLRRSQSTYGKFFAVELNDVDGKYLYIPKGFAHGFCSLEDGSICNYVQTTCYDPNNDCGIDSLSIGFDWGIESPIRSGRDLTFPNLNNFISPFE